jgi:hypothetical protein
VALPEPHQPVAEPGPAPAASQATPALSEPTPTPSRTPPASGGGKDPWLREHATQAALVVTALAGIAARGLSRRGRRRH